MDMRIKTLLLIAAAILGAGCRRAPQEIVIFHTNDIHGHFLPEPAAWREDQALVGGFAVLYDELQRQRARYPQSLYLDAGDLMTGNPVCNLEYNGVKGGALLEMLRLCGVSAMALGNHEFDLGVEHVRDFVAAAPFPVLCCNLRERSSGQPLAQPAVVLRVGRLRVGIIGVILDNLAASAARKNIEPFDVLASAAAVQEQIDKLDPATDLLVLLTHLGFDSDSILATRIRGVDVIVGGHSHTRLSEPRRVNGVIIAQAGSYAKNLGVLRLTVAADSVAASDGELLELAVPAALPPSPVGNLADSLAGVIHREYGHIIGDVATPWIRSYFTGSNAGNWICDRLRERYRADIALINAGGIRADLAPGPVSRLDVAQMLPFSNSVVTFAARGAELRKMAQEQARAQGLREHGALEMSGVTIDYRKQDGSVAVTAVDAGGVPLRDERIYRVVSIDYVAISQSDRYLRFQPREIEATGEMITDVIMDEIQRHAGPLTADGTPRLREVP